MFQSHYVQGWHSTSTFGSLGAAAAPGNAAGKIGNAVQLVRASSQYLQATDNADLSMGDIDFEISVDVMLDSTPAGAMVIYSRLSDTDRSVMLYWDNTVNRLKWLVTATANAWDASVTASTFGALSTGVWYHINAYHDSVNNQIGVSVNNGTVDTANYAGGCRDSASPIVVGQQGGVAYWDGRIDNLHIWKNRILTADERTALWNNSNGREYPFAA